MSETTKSPEQTVGDLQAQISARVDELKTHVGKTFRPKDGSGRPVKITGYGGVLHHQEFRDGKPVKISSHVFKTDTMFTPPATKFLDEYEEIPAVASEVNNQPV